MSRRHVALRWHPQNAVSLVPERHMYYDQNPFKWVAWCKERFGDDLIDELQMVANQSVKWSKPLREDIYQHYRKELSRIEKLRAQGVSGRIEVEPHEIMHRFAA